MTRKGFEFESSVRMLNFLNLGHSPGFLPFLNSVKKILIWIGTMMHIQNLSWERRKYSLNTKFNLQAHFIIVFHIPILLHMLQRTPLLVPKTEQYFLSNSIVHPIGKRLCMPSIKFSVLAVEAIQIAMLTMNQAINLTTDLTIQRHLMLCHWMIFYSHMKWK